MTSAMGSSFSSTARLTEPGFRSGTTVGPARGQVCLVAACCGSVSRGAEVLVGSENGTEKYGSVYWVDGTGFNLFTQVYRRIRL